MSTRARIKFLHDGQVIGGIYYSIDGHIWCFAPTLIAALRETSPQNLLESKRLLNWMGEFALYDGVVDKDLDYLCEVEISHKGCLVKLYKWGGELLFEGSLAEFAERYEKDD